MRTINISLPNQQASFIDQMVSRYGFASRSEFIRGLVRLLAYRPEILAESTIFPFSVPKEKSIKKIVTDFKKTKKYSPEFLKDLETGLKTSSYFQK